MMRYLVLLIGVWLPALIMAGGHGKEKEEIKKTVKSCLKKPEAGSRAAKKVVVAEEVEVQEFESCPEDSVARAAEFARIQRVVSGDEAVEVSADEARENADNEDYEKGLADLVEKVIADATELKSVEPLERLAGVLRDLLAMPALNNRRVIINTYRNRLANEINVFQQKLASDLHMYEQGIAHMFQDRFAEAKRSNNKDPLVTLVQSFEGVLKIPKIGEAKHAIVRKYIARAKDEISIMGRKQQEDKVKIKFEQDLAKMFQDALDEATKAKSVEPLKKLSRMYAGILKTEGLGETNYAIARDYSARVEDEISNMNAKE